MKRFIINCLAIYGAYHLIKKCCKEGLIVININKPQNNS